jgi:hypothetical protein
VDLAELEALERLKPKRKPARPKPKKKVRAPHVARRQQHERMLSVEFLDEKGRKKSKAPLRDFAVKIPELCFEEHTLVNEKVVAASLIVPGYGYEFAASALNP